MMFFTFLQFEEILEEDCYILMGFLWEGGGGISFLFSFVVVGVFFCVVFFLIFAIVAF